MANILVVDDEHDVRDLLRFLLENEGHTVRTAHDGQDALDQVGQIKPDMILLDVMMPVMDGYTVFTRLAENDETRAIPVLILTAKGQMREVFQMSSNIVGTMDKPFDPVLLREKVAAVLAGRR